MTEQAIEVEIERVSAEGAPAALPERTWFLPSLGDLLFVLLAILVPVITATALVSGDGDVARHLRLGEWMVQHRTILRFDNFSFTKAGEPFLPFEWGSGVVYALAHGVGGLAAVSILAGILIALSIALVMVFLRGRGVDPTLALLVTLLATAHAAIHWIARPHLFTFVGTVLLLFLLERKGEPRYWPFIPLFAIWANLHGGFFFGLVLIGIYLAGSVAEWVTDSHRDRWRPEIRYHAQALAVATAACLVNPFGWRLLAHVTDFVGGQRFIKQYTQEFQSPNFHTLEPKLFLVTVLGIVGLLAITRARPTYPRILVFLATAAFALIYQRNIALFGIVALPLLALHFDSSWRAIRLPGLARVRRVVEEGDGAGRLGPWTGFATLALVLLAVSGGTVAGTSLVANRIDPTKFPVEAVERARAAGLEGRIFSEFVWGGYLLYAWPEQRVFIDGGSDFYGEDVMRAYMEVRELRPGWREALEAWNIAWVLVPPTAALAHELNREVDWHIWYCDDTAVLLQRTAASAPAPIPGGDATCLVPGEASVLGRMRF